MRPSHTSRAPASSVDSTTDPQDTSLPGLVIVNYGKHLLLEDGDGRLLRCVSRREAGNPVCGDRVRWARTGDNEGVVERIEERRSLLQRAVGENQHKPLAANIDQVVIEAATEPSLDSLLIDKYTIAAELAGTTPLIVVNKSDLLTPAMRAEIDALLEEYRAIGYVCLFTSALSGDGIDAFLQQLSGKSSILVGQSGVGKSSLIKRLLPDMEIATGKLSAASGQGKHTTTATTLYHLPGGGNLIDSPGVRDFHLGKVNPEVLGAGFREFRDCSGQCRFRNCLHQGEPGCAVDAAAKAGSISARRLENYRKLLVQHPA